MRAAAPAAARTPIDAHRGQSIHRQPSARRDRAGHPAGAVAARDHQALRWRRRADGRVVRGAAGRGARPARRERRGQVDADERRLGRPDPGRRHDRVRRPARRGAHAGAGPGPRDRHRPPAPGALPRHDGGREPARHARPRAPAAARPGHPCRNAHAARRRALRRPPRGPCLVAQRGPATPARAGEGLRGGPAAAHPGRADGPVLAGRRGPAVQRRPAARGRGHGGRVHHPPAGRGARDREPRDGAARRPAAGHHAGRRHHRRGPARDDHRPHARGDLPAEARARRRGGAAPAGRGPERQGLREHLLQRSAGRDHRDRRRRRQRPARAAAGTGGPRQDDRRVGCGQREVAVQAPAPGQRRLHARGPPDRGPDDRPQRARERGHHRARLLHQRTVREPPARGRCGAARALRAGRQGAVARGTRLGAVRRQPAEGRDVPGAALGPGRPGRRRADAGRRRGRPGRDLPPAARDHRPRRPGGDRLERRARARGPVRPGHRDVSWADRGHARGRPGERGADRPRRHQRDDPHRAASRRAGPAAPRACSGSSRATTPRSASWPW